MAMKCGIYGFDDYEDCFVVLGPGKDIDDLSPEARRELPGEPSFIKKMEIIPGGLYLGLNPDETLDDLRRQGYHFNWARSPEIVVQTRTITVTTLCGRCGKVIKTETVRKRSVGDAADKEERHTVCLACWKKHCSLDIDAEEKQEEQKDEGWFRKGEETYRHARYLFCECCGRLAGAEPVHTAGGKAAATLICTACLKKNYPEQYAGRKGGHV